MAARIEGGLIDCIVLCETLIGKASNYALEYSVASELPLKTMQ